MITTNPARWVELPASRRPRAVVWTPPRVALWRATGERPAVAVWTVEQTVAFLDQVRGHRMFPLFWLAALLGLRRGEVVGLRWCDIDLDEQVLTVSHQIQEHGGHAVLVAPKSDRSRRTIALDHVTTAMLRRHHEQGVSPSGFLCVKSDGTPWSPSYVTHTFRKLVAEADLPPVRFHDLRHGAASLSLAAGNDLKVVQALLGHDSIVPPPTPTPASYPVWPTVPPKPPSTWSSMPPATEPSDSTAETAETAARQLRHASSLKIYGPIGAPGHTSDSPKINANQQDP